MVATLNWPNRITIARIFLIAPYVWAMLHLQDSAWARWAALGIFATMAVGDFADGLLARRLHQQTSLGAFLDPLADKILVVCAVLLLANSQTCIVGKQLPPYAVVAAIGKDLVVVIGFALVFLATGKMLIRPSILGKGCTTVQLAMVVATLLSPSFQPIRPLWFLPDILWAASAVLAFFAAIDYVRSGVKFVEESESHG